MDQERTQQTEQIIAEMLKFLETNSEDEQERKDKCNVANISNKKHLTENKNNNVKPKKKLKKWKQKILFNTKEIVQEIGQKPEMLMNDKIEVETAVYTTFYNLNWQLQLENCCRHSYDNTFTQEVYKAMYQSTEGHPCHGCADYYTAAQNYALYGKHFLDFPPNIQVLLNDRTYQSSGAQSSIPISNFGSCMYAKPSITLPYNNIPGNGVPATAAYYQILNNMQGQARAALSANLGNSTTYGIVMGNKVTYVAGTSTTPSLIYNQHNTTTTNFISNSLANAALVTSPTILYTNPLLTTSIQQYLMQYLSATALTSNSTTVSTNAGGGSAYEHMIYSQMSRQHLYQTQQCTGVAAMFQSNHRVVNPVTRQTGNRSAAQHVPGASFTDSSNGYSFCSCYQIPTSTSPRQLTELQLQTSNIIEPTDTSEHARIFTC